ncbi:HAMP domain-containing sensor histidine kinase [Rhodanobacter sp. L36]|uniref:sensor histidine kinase n=1 Tax=Rhodanobacter sp. L36 TaxID=1747221 RepID=UPI00131CE61B|nr:HAMP domain-containing sensor histidine kinase [Rhodanobacter sp. L36]
MSVKHEISGPSHNPLVVGEPKLKFYAGVVLKRPDGLPIGTVCVSATVTRNLDTSQLDALRALARQVMVQLELRKLLKGSEETSQYRARLLAAVSHDLRSPLTVAMHSVKKARTDAAPAQMKYLDMADESMESLKQGFIRMLPAGSGNSTFSLAAFGDTDLGAIFDAVKTIATPAAKRKQIDVRMVQPRLHVLTDAAQLETLIGNLVANAVKYTPKGNRILLGCRRRKTRIEVQVIDTGIGMEVTEIDSMFEAFRHADSHSEGLGLGLWLVRRTAEALRMDISVHASRINTKFAQYVRHVELYGVTGNRPFQGYLKCMITTVLFSLFVL